MDMQIAWLIAEKVGAPGASAHQRRGPSEGFGDQEQIVAICAAIHANIGWRPGK
jgi:hypothetical protein